MKNPALIENKPETVEVECTCDTITVRGKEFKDVKGKKITVPARSVATLLTHGFIKDEKAEVKNG